MICGPSCHNKKHIFFEVELQPPILDFSAKNVDYQKIICQALCLINVANFCLCFCSSIVQENVRDLRVCNVKSENRKGFLLAPMSPIYCVNKDHYTQQIKCHNQHQIYNQKLNKKA